MSETPNEIVTRWLDEGSAVLTTPPAVREAIRAVLEDLRLRDIDCGCNNRVTRLEAERGTLRARLGEYALALTQEANLRRDAEAGCAAAWREVNLARAERDTMRAERRSLLEQLARKDAERNELRAEVVRLERARLRSADWVTLDKAEAEVARLTLLCLDLVDPKLDTAPLPTSQPARAIEVCKRAAEPPREGKP